MFPLCTFASSSLCGKNNELAFTKSCHDARIINIYSLCTFASSSLCGNNELPFTKSCHECTNKKHLFFVHLCAFLPLWQKQRTAIY